MSIEIRPRRRRRIRRGIGIGTGLPGGGGSEEAMEAKDGEEAIQVRMPEVDRMLADALGGHGIVGGRHDGGRTRCCCGRRWRIQERKALPKQGDGGGGGGGVTQERHH